MVSLCGRGRALADAAWNPCLPTIWISFPASVLGDFADLFPKKEGPSLLHRPSRCFSLISRGLFLKGGETVSEVSQDLSEAEMGIASSQNSNQCQPPMGFQLATDKPRCITEGLLCVWAETNDSWPLSLSSQGNDAGVPRQTLVGAELSPQDSNSLQSSPSPRWEPDTPSLSPDSPCATSLSLSFLTCVM